MTLLTSKCIHSKQTYLIPCCAGSRCKKRLREWWRTGTPCRGRNCLGMVAFIRDPVPPASKTNPTSSKSTSCSPLVADNSNNDAACERRVPKAKPNDACNPHKSRHTGTSIAIRHIMVSVLCSLTEQTPLE